MEEQPNHLYEVTASWTTKVVAKDETSAIARASDKWLDDEDGDLEWEAHMIKE